MSFYNLNISLDGIEKIDSMSWINFLNEIRGKINYISFEKFEHRLYDDKLLKLESDFIEEIIDDLFNIVLILGKYDGINISDIKLFINSDNFEQVNCEVCFQLIVNNSSKYLAFLDEIQNTEGVNINNFGIFNIIVIRAENFYDLLTRSIKAILTFYKFGMRVSYIDYYISGG